MNSKLVSVLFALLFSMSAAAQPNGNRFPQPIPQPAPPPYGESDPGSDPGSMMPMPIFQNDPSYLWCGNVLAVLQEARDQADMALSMGNAQSAQQILMSGLRQAAAPGFQIQPLTARAIARGPQLASAVTAVVAGAPNGLQTATHFLLGYYDFIIHVANDLDLSYYIPYQYCHRRHCGDYAVDEGAFEERFVEYAKAQVQLVLDNLAESYGYQVFPIGNPRAYLKALELTTGYAVNDLQQSLWSARYACGIQSLARLRQRLASFNAGSPIPYQGNPVIAVSSSYQETQDILGSINVGYGCSGR
ncbi:hypothetical protein WDW37_04545 [Bdellovibrionota bacterium FG-1]